MARPRNLVPAYRKHSKTGRAAVSIYRADGSRTEVLLPGPYGSNESKHEYEILLAQLRANDGKAQARSASSDMTIVELVERFMGEHVENHYRHPDGTPSGEIRDYALTVRPLIRLFASMPACEFTPLALRAYRDAIVSATWMTQALRCGPQIVPEYLARALQWFAPMLLQTVRGTTADNISTDVLRRLEIPVPPLAEQKRIAAILDQADAVRRKRQHALHLADDFLRATFLDMFGDPVRNPNRWGEANLEHVAEVGSGVAKGKDYNGKPTSEVPYLRVANVQDGYLDLKEIKFLDVPSDEAIRYRLQSGDVLLTEGGDFDKLGRGTVWAGEIPNCIHQNHIFRVRLNQEKVLPFYVSFLIGSERGKKYFLRAGKQTTGIATINSMQLKQFPVLLPPIALQRRFLNCVENFHQLNGRLTKVGSITEDLFNSLVQRAFRGDL